MISSAAGWQKRTLWPGASEVRAMACDDSNRRRLGSRAWALS